MVITKAEIFELTSFFVESCVDFLKELGLLNGEGHIGLLQLDIYNEINPPSPPRVGWLGLIRHPFSL